MPRANTAAVATLRPQRFIDDYLSYLLARTSFMVARQFHANVKRHGMAVPTWRVLATLSDGQGYSIGELAGIVLFEQPTLTKVVDRMTAENLVVRRAAPDDRRKTLVFITPAGRARVRPLLLAAKRHEADVLKAYSAREIALLKNVLRRLIESCEAMGKPARSTPVR
jgi:DNA-binding MarR family transcriptional regulator